MDKSWINHRPSIVYCLLPLKLSNDLHHHRKTIPLETEFPSSTTVKLVIILKSDLIRGRTFELFDRAVLCTIKQKRKKRKISCSSLIWRATVPRISSRRAIVTLYRFTRGQHWHSTPGIVGYFSYCLSNIKFLRATRRLSRALIAGTGRNFRFRNCENVQWTQSGYFSSSMERQLYTKRKKDRVRVHSFWKPLFFSFTAEKSFDSCHNCHNLRKPLRNIILRGKTRYFFHFIAIKVRLDTGLMNIWKNYVKILPRREDGTERDVT